jgi:Tfp pilus assembly major pilin PilA
MKSGRKGRRKILAIITGGIIAGILAAIAAPLYTGYVERARVAEATSIMEAIITSQKVAKARTGKYYSASTVAEFKSQGINITDTKYFAYATTPTPNGGFIVGGRSTDAFGAAGGWMAYIYDPSENPPGRWSSSEGTILPDILPLLT